jgi:hypothetical protein
MVAVSLGDRLARVDHRLIEERHCSGHVSFPLYPSVACAL